jgi:Arc/MetJ-type ribon-helix-helix transcriptional regulator
MSITVRLPESLETELRRRFDRGALSSFIRRAIEAQLAREPPAQSPHELAVEMGLIGAIASGRDDLSERSTRKRLVKERINAKHRR